MPTSNLKARLFNHKLMVRLSNLYHASQYDKPAGFYHHIYLIIINNPNANTMPI